MFSDHYRMLRAQYQNTFCTTIMYLNLATFRNIENITLDLFYWCELHAIEDFVNNKCTNIDPIKK